MEETYMTVNTVNYKIGKKKHENKKTTAQREKRLEMLIKSAFPRTKTSKDFSSEVHLAALQGFEP